jgi:hypothetical protein
VGWLDRESFLGGGKHHELSPGIRQHAAAEFDAADE